MEVCKVKIFLSASSGRHIGDNGSRPVVAQRTGRPGVCLAKDSLRAISDRGVTGSLDGGWLGSRKSGCGQSRKGERARGNDAGTPARIGSSSFSYFGERSPSIGK
jgi:hypothetical protein